MCGLVCEIEIKFSDIDVVYILNEGFYYDIELVFVLYVSNESINSYVLVMDEVYCQFFDG